MKNWTAAVVLAVVGIGGFAGADEAREKPEWAQLRGGPGFTGVSPDDAVKPPLRLVWSYRTDSDTSGDAGSGLTVGGGKVFGNMEMTSSIIALDAERGRFLWEYRHKYADYKQTSSYADGRLYVWLRSRGHSELVALDAETGRELWSKTFISSGDVRHYRREGPLLYEGKVFIADMNPDGESEPVMTALDGRTGEEVWRQPLGLEHGALIVAPCAGGGRIFTGTRTPFSRKTKEAVHGRVLALNPADGSEIWSNADLYPSAHMVTDGRILVCKINRQIGMAAADNQRMYVLDAATGKALWSDPIKKLSGSETITDDLVLQRHYGIGGLTAFDRKTGEKRWHLGIRMGSGCSSPSVSGNFAYMGSGSFNDSEGIWAWRFDEPPHRKKGEEGVSWTLHGIDLQTGESKWRFLTGCNVCGDPAIAYGRVYFNSRDGRIYCLEPIEEGEAEKPEFLDESPNAEPAEIRRLLAEKQPAWRPGLDWPMLGGNADRAAQAPPLTMPLEPAWQLDTGGRVTGSAAICDGRVFVGSLSGNIIAADLHSGTKVWEFETGAEVRCSPAVAEGVVYCGSDDGKFYAIDAASGEEKWSYRCGGPVQASPAIYGGVVVFGANDHNIYMLDRRTGKKLWSFRGDHQLVQAPPVVRADRVYAAQWVDWAYALDATTGRRIWRTCVPISIESLQFHHDRLWLRSPRQAAEFDPESGQRLRLANIAYGYNGFGFLGDLLFFTGTRATGVLDLTDPGILNKYAEHFPALKDVHVVKAGRVPSSPRLASAGTPLVAGDLVCFTSIDGEVLIVEPDPKTTGERSLRQRIVWSHELGGTCHSSPVAADGHLVIGCDDGKLYAFRARTDGGEKP